jgi:hypothetical protein
MQVDFLHIIHYNGNIKGGGCIGTKNGIFGEADPVEK